MPQKYFSSFPQIDYALPDRSRILLTDITPGVITSSSTAESLVSYATYEIVDNERPDVVSQILYGTPDYAWTFFQINPFLKNGINSWPKTVEELGNFVETKYKNLGVMTIDMMTFIGDRDGVFYGSLVYINLEKYAEAGMLKLQPIKDGNPLFESAKIIHFDRYLLQLTIDTTDIENIDLFFSGTEFILIADESSSLYDEFLEEISKTHGIEKENVKTIIYEILLDNKSRPFNWSRKQDAPITYVDPGSGNTISLGEFSSINRFQSFLNIKMTNGDDVLQFSTGENARYSLKPGFPGSVNTIPNRTSYVSLNPTISWITYEENEILLNGKRKRIRVIDPSQIREYARTYFDVLKTL